MERPFPAYKGDEPFLFVCYSHEDSNTVYPEIQWLRDQDINVWYDEGISAGKNWRAVTGDSLLGAGHVLFFISKASLESEHCNREINLALDEGKEIIPIYLEEVELTSDLKIGLGRVQALFNNDASYHRYLLDALGEQVTSSTSPISHEKKRSLPLYGSVAIMVLITGLFAWYGLNFFGKDVVDAQIRSIAVLPLVNLSGDPAQEYFADGTTDMLIQNLGKIRSLRVISRQSVMRYKKSEKSAREIAEELNVDGLLTGSVIETQGKIRFAVQFYELASNSNIWAEHYDRDFTNILTLQSDIALAVSEQINIKLTSSELAALSATHEVDPESYKAYLLGHSQLSIMNIEPAIVSLERAIELDPTNADALAELARATNLLVWGGGPHEELTAEVRRYIKRALALVPDHSHAKANEALLLFFEDREYQHAINGLAELLNADPNDMFVLLYYGYALQITDRPELTLQLRNRMIEMDPLNPQWYESRGLIELWLGRYEKALTSFEQAESLGFQIPVYLANLAFLRGDREGLATQFKREWGNNSAWHPVFEAFLARLDGDMQRVQDLVEPYDHEKGVTSWWRQSYYPLLLGDTERAVEYYSRALDNREPQALMRALGGVGDRSTYPEFYNNPRYKEMLRANGLDPKSIAELKIPPFPF